MEILTKSNIEDFQKWLLCAYNEGAAALIDKEAEWTSFDVVAKLRNLLKVKKVGHAGTLDPLATGLLILCFGKATKLLSGFQGLKKKYSAVAKLGATTVTDDAQAEEENIRDLKEIDESRIIEALSSLKGKILQKPPIYSAKKIGGQRLYSLARKNKPVEPKPVEVEIFNIDIKKIEMPLVYFDVECSKGTYIRSIARDMGEKLGCGAYLLQLRRTHIGEYSVDEALRIEEIIESLKIEN